MSTNANKQSNHLLSVIFLPQFATFFLSVIFSQISANMLNIVLIILTYKLTHSNFAVSILVMIFLIPQVFFSFFGGIIADAKNKRKILIFGNISRALALFLLFFVKGSLAFVYFFDLVIATVTQFYIPAEAPIIPHLVKKDQLLSANAIFGVCLFGSILVGYVGAGPAIQLFGEAGVFLFMSGMFVLSGVFVFFMPDVSPSIRKLREKDGMVANSIHLYRLVVSEFRDMVVVIRQTRTALSSLVFLSFSQVIILILATIVPDYAQKTLNVMPEDISLYIFAPAALGMIIASIIIGGKFAKTNKELIIGIGIFVSSLALFLFALIDLLHNINLADSVFAITFIAGIANACVFIPSQTIIQSTIGHKYLSKVYGILYSVIAVIAFVPIILAGVFADVLGVRWVLLGLAVLLLGVGIGRIIYNRRKN
jgi:MFS family permease